jgi:hypothetical protein
VLFLQVKASFKFTPIFDKSKPKPNNHLIHLWIQNEMKHQTEILFLLFKNSTPSTFQFHRFILLIQMLIYQQPFMKINHNSQFINSNLNYKYYHWQVSQGGIFLMDKNQLNRPLKNALPSIDSFGISNINFEFQYFLLDLTGANHHQFQQN